LRQAAEVVGDLGRADDEAENADDRGPGREGRKDQPEGGAGRGEADLLRRLFVSDTTG
jgi:hypothetical protein